VHDSFDAEEFVKEQYLKILRRVPDKPGLAYYVSRLEKGEMTQEDVISSMMGSSEYRTTLKSPAGKMRFWLKKLSSRLKNPSTLFFSASRKTKKIWLRIENRLQGGIPLPSSQLMCYVQGSDDVAGFLKGGMLAATSMRDILARNGIDFHSFHAILDFGCGSGRVMRHFRDLGPHRLYGTDYNPPLIDWCRRHFDFAEFRVNAIDSRLDFEDEKFDFIYALSVFTHLSENLQAFWMAELTRVLRRGGYLFMTTHGEYFFKDLLSEEDRRRVARGEVVVTTVQRAGENACGAYHPKSYVVNKLARHLRLVEHVPEGALGNANQDVYLFQKS
jgi:SAM-dependent methyltransferase